MLLGEKVDMYFNMEKLWWWQQLDGGDDDDWGEDFSEEAVKQRMDELSGAAKGLALTDDLEKTDKDRMDILYKLIKVGSS